MNLFTGTPALGAANPATSKQVALPSSGLTFRRLFLPSAAKSVRQQVVAEELSYSLPFPLAEAHYGTVERGDEAWVVIAADSVVAPLRDLYPKAELEAEPLCYLRAARAAGISTALVVDFGATKTVFCGLENGQVGNVRVLLRGGERLTDEVMAAAGCSREQAEILKREEGVTHKTVRQFYLELVEEIVRKRQEGALSGEDDLREIAAIDEDLLFRLGRLIRYNSQYFRVRIDVSSPPGPIRVQAVIQRDDKNAKVVRWEVY